MQISREDLYDRVWREPMRTIAPTLRLSDVGLRKICVKAHIPVPERGHWARVQAGKKAIKPALPPRPPGMRSTVLIGETAEHRWYAREAEIMSRIPVMPDFPEPLEMVEQRVTKLTEKVRFTKSLEPAHPAVARLLQSDETRRQKQAASAYPFAWEAPQFEGPFERRRLRLANALFLAAARLDGRGSLTTNDGWQLAVQFHDSTVIMGLDTPANLKKDSRTQRLERGDARSTLRLVIHGSRNEAEVKAWEDGETGKVEDHLRSILTQVMVAAERSLREQEARDYTWWIERREEILEKRRLAEEAAQQKIREELERQRQARIDNLIGHASRLHDAERIRELVRRAAAEQEAQDPAAFRRWTEWALSVADDLDPIRSGRLQPVLDEMQDH